MVEMKKMISPLSALVVVQFLTQSAAFSPVGHSSLIRPNGHAVPKQPTSTESLVTCAAKKRRRRPKEGGGDSAASASPELKQEQPRPSSPPPPPPKTTEAALDPLKALEDLVAVEEAKQKAAAAEPAPAPVSPAAPAAASAAAEKAALDFGLPFPSEASYGAGESSEDNNLFELPDVADLEAKRVTREAARKTKKKDDARAAKAFQDPFATPAELAAAAGYDDAEDGASASAEAFLRESKRIERRDLKALRDRLEVDPSADYDEGTFVKTFDTASALLAESGRPFLGIQAQFLQAGHGILLLTALLCAFVEYPGNPLTEFPAEIRTFLKTGLALTTAINAALAVFSLGVSGEKNQPAPLWAAKTFVLGGLAFDELHRAPKLKPKGMGKKGGAKKQRRG